MRRDSYHPFGRTAECPHCHAIYPDAPVPTAVFRCILFDGCCPKCQGEWSEVRRPGRTTRTWEHPLVVDIRHIR
jgi:hypothetical protein